VRGTAGAQYLTGRERKGESETEGLPIRRKGE